MERHQFEPAREPKPEVPAFIRKLMPTASEEELQEATSNVRRYLDIVVRIFEEKERQPKDGVPRPEDIQP